MPIETKIKRNKELIKLHKKGWGYKKLAAHFGIHPSTVKGIIIRGENIRKYEKKEELTKG